MVAILVAKLGILALVAVGVLLLQGAHVVGLCTGILRSGEAELAGALCLTIEGLQGLHVLALLGHADELEAVLGLRQQVLVVVSVSLEEGAALLLRHLVQTEAHHARNDIGHITLHEIADIAFLLVGSGIVLHHNHHLAHLHLLVLVEDIDGLVVVGNRLGNHLRRIGVNLDASEELLDLSLHVVYIDIANDDDGLIVRTIPLMIVGAQGSGLETVDDRHQTDRHTQTVLGTGVHLGQRTGNHAL